jgi:mannosyl-3-phosphoglycerate phosphatase
VAPDLRSIPIVFFTDLDGTLLDHDSYLYAEALPALGEIARRQCPLVLCTSKTRAETEVWRRRLSNHHPFIVENGGAVFVPAGYFGEPVSGAIRDAYEVLEAGTAYAELVDALRAAANRTGCRVRGFSVMSVDEIARACSLPLEDAALASRREYDEPFTILDAQRAPELLAAIEALGKRHTAGGRFHHITGDNDKAAAVQTVIELYRRHSPCLVTAGLGDGLNDAAFLNVVDYAIILPSRQTETLRAAVPHGVVANQSGPAGWNAAVLRLLSQVLPD